MHQNNGAILHFSFYDILHRLAYHQDDKCHGKDEAYRDNDAQPRFDMNRASM